MASHFKFHHPNGFSLVLFQPKFILQLVSQFSFEISASGRGPISAPGWLLLSVVPAKVRVFTQAEVFEVVPVGPTSILAMIIMLMCMVTRVEVMTKVELVLVSWC